MLMLDQNLVVKEDSQELDLLWREMLSMFLLD